MKHNVTISETRLTKLTVEDYWTIRGVSGCTGQPKKVVCEKEYDHNPSIEEIAGFLNKSEADFASVEHNYRLEPELPFD